MFIALLEVLAVIGIVTALCYYVPYFYLAAWATEIFCVIRIIASDDNPDYKVPWLLFVLIIPIAGFMLYFMFYSRMLKNIADTHIFTDTKQEYFPLGEDMHQRLLQDLNTAEKFIYMEYFIIEEGKFWNSILDILKKKSRRRY